MLRWYCFGLAILSLWIGLLGYDPLQTRIIEPLAKYIGSAWAWLATLLAPLVVLAPLVTIGGQLYDRYKRRAARMLLARRVRCLANISGSAKDLQELLLVIERELAIEHSFTPNSRKRLIYLVETAYTEILKTEHYVKTTNYILAQGLEIGQATFELLRSINDHAKAEMHDPLTQVGPHTKTNTIGQVREARWGAGCVLRLLRQLENYTTALTPAAGVAA